MSLTATHRSSGDFRADRRYEYARAAFDERDFAAAADLARQVIELAPGFAAAHALLGRSLAMTGPQGEAVTALLQALELEPEDALGLRIDLARLGALEPGAAIADGYVRALFDGYAPRFEKHLTESLGYCGPDLIVEALRRVCATGSHPVHFERALDLGCGTGLMAKALQGAFGTMEGVDLSGRMLERARQSGLYAGLHQGHLTPFLVGRGEGEADLVIAADVFIYLADLAPVFRETHRVLKPGGLFVFTVQSHPGDGVVLGHDARYAHSETCLRELAETVGFTILVFERASIREDRGAPVPGFLCVLQR
ncbi:class I SAM-dependent DNA methyltransferase [Microvirga roseola]|uniref:class I SAM-dependent DNA methyltransferase n=1 Tax=Microvirga roseola TaxID=2883126 RepID=UPI001E445FAB|nr:methyltransferase domain-containing protein [Microvirga roseola]